MPALYAAPVIECFADLIFKGHSNSRRDSRSPRLARLRQGQGLTQKALGARVGQSNRMIAYYEREDAEPPGALLPALAHALGVTTDELLGLKPLADAPAPKTARLRRRLQKVEELPPPADQRTVLKLVDALHQTRTRKRAAN
jgi:transcriptional regulator with XRE-family HTH domain